MNQKDENKNEITLDKIKSVKGLFAERMGGKDFRIGETVFKLGGLTSDVLSYSVAKSTMNGKVQEPLLRFYFCQFGIKDISNPTYSENGKPVKIEKEYIEVLETEYEVIPMTILRMLAPEILVKLYVEIVNLTTMKSDEEDKLDFTTPCEPKA